MAHLLDRYRLRKQSALKRSGGVIVPADRPLSIVALAYFGMVVHQAVLPSRRGSASAGI
jgi:hypothetical protein